ncbi:MAG: RES domain-containing protein [Anaerolineales bacterium]|nr:RES domain-containing protein [Anaerolineales bacterium]
MKVYRIAKERYIKDLSGEGARRYGGRWNKKGTSVVYTAENRSLATVEYLVHLPIALVPADTYIAELTIPDQIEYEQIKIRDLPRQWAAYPAPLALADIGEAWVRKGGTLLLKVPSSVVRGEWNVLLNPQHRLFGEVALTGVEPYSFDERLVKSRKKANS